MPATHSDVIRDILRSRYRLHGRGNGFYDCYGAVLVMARADGYDLQDITEYEGCDSALSSQFVPTLNVETIDAPRRGALIEMMYGDELHLGYCLNEQEFIHMTRNGGRINRIGALKIRRVYGITSRI